MSLSLKPPWLRVKAPAGPHYERLRSLIHALNLHTVCEESLCPNIAECWGGGTATFMLLGDTCTRACRFCAVNAGNPKGALDPLEPIRVARAVSEVGLDYVVLTSVNRDDLPDGGAGHFAEVVKAIKRERPEVIVEALIPDFQGDVEALRRVVEAGPEVIAHNVETTERLTPLVRDPRASYRQSLKVLADIKRLDPARLTKSSLMLGLGESEDEVIGTMKDLRRVEVDFLTLGQYLRPTSSRRHLEVVEYVAPAKFERLRRVGEELGFRYVAAGPLVRSSYRAGEFYTKSLLQAAPPRGSVAPAEAGTG